jgi:hypothetical protein
MGEVIEMFPGGTIDPHDDIDITLTKGDALIIMDHIRLIQEAYQPDEDSQVLDDFYWMLCDAVWPDDGEA